MYIYCTHTQSISCSHAATAVLYYTVYMFKVTMHAFSVHTYTCTYMYMHVLLFPQDNIPDQVITRIQPYIDNEDFTPVAISKVSKACTSICQWVHEISCHHVWLSRSHC